MEQSKFTMSTGMIYLGDIWYQYDANNNINIKRIVKCKNTNKFVVSDGEGNLETITRNELINGYSRLKNDAYFTFFIVKLDKGAKDVAVTIHRRDDLDKNEKLPYTICRQQVNNLFNEQMIVDNLYHLGISISKDTCPPESNYADAFVCNGVQQGRTISVYIGDTLTSILDLVDTKEYDKVLTEIDDNVNKNICEGTCRSLRELLEYHDLMFDFFNGFQIIRVPFEIKDNTIDNEQIKYLEHITKHTFLEYICVPNDFDIELDKIERSHVRVVDTANNVYIITYNKGDYVNDYYKRNFKDKRDTLALLKYRNSRLNAIKRKEETTRN